jgi:hypothetical protein
MNSPTVWLGQLDDNGTPMMKLTRRQSLQMATAAIALPAIVNSAWALDYPTRPVRLIIGYPPGGSADLTARLASAWLSERLGQQFVVESRTGAATTIATEAVVNAAPDRLHAVACRTRERDQCRAVRQAQFRFHPGYCAGRSAHSFSRCGRRQSGSADPQHSRIDRLCEGQSRPAQLCLVPASAQRSTSPANCSR